MTPIDQSVETILLSLFESACTPGGVMFILFVGLLLMVAFAPSISIGGHKKK